MGKWSSRDPEDSCLRFRPIGFEALESVCVYLCVCVLFVCLFAWGGGEGGAMQVTYKVQYVYCKSYHVCTGGYKDNGQGWSGGKFIQPRCFVTGSSCSSCHLPLIDFVADWWWNFTCAGAHDSSQNSFQTDMLLSCWAMHECIQHSKLWHGALLLWLWSMKSRKSQSLYTHPLQHVFFPLHAHDMNAVVVCTSTLDIQQLASEWLFGISLATTVALVSQLSSFLHCCSSLKHSLQFSAEKFQAFLLILSIYVQLWFYMTVVSPWNLDSNIGLLKTCSYPIFFLFCRMTCHVLTWRLKRWSSCAISTSASSTKSSKHLIRFTWSWRWALGRH